MNLSNNSTQRLPEFPEVPLPKFSGISMAFFATVGVIANGIVLFVLVVSQRRKFSIYRYLIAHLSLADFFCSIMHIVYVPVELRKHEWVLPRSACKVVYPSITFFETLAIGTILIISFERYKGVILPHWREWRKINIWLMLCGVWVIDLLLVIPNIIKIQVTKYKNLNYCNEKWPEHTKWRQVYGLGFFFLGFFLPAISVCVMHARIMWRLKQRTRPSNNSYYRERIDARIKRVLTGIIIAFFVCTSPNKILYLIWDIFPKLEMDLSSHIRYYLRTFQILYFARVAVDPLIYCFFDTRFKQDFEYTRKVVCGRSVITETSENSSRVRTRTLSTQPAITDPTLVYSNPNICNGGIEIVRYNGITSDVDFVGSPTSLTIIQEATALNFPVPTETASEKYSDDNDSNNSDNNNEKRSRTESIVTERTTVCGSSSPAGLSSTSLINAS